MLLFFVFTSLLLHSFLEYLLVYLDSLAHVLVVRSIVIVLLETICSDSALVSFLRHKFRLFKEITSGQGIGLEVFGDDDLLRSCSSIAEGVPISAVVLDDLVVNVFVDRSHQ